MVILLSSFSYYHLGHLLKNLPWNLPHRSLFVRSSLQFWSSKKEACFDRGRGVVCFNKNLEALLWNPHILLRRDHLFSRTRPNIAGSNQRLRKLWRLLPRMLDRDFLQEVWLEQLNQSCRTAGAKGAKKVSDAFKITKCSNWLNMDFRGDNALWLTWPTCDSERIRSTDAAVWTFQTLQTADNDSLGMCAQHTKGTPRCYHVWPFNPIPPNERWT